MPSGDLRLGREGEAGLETADGLDLTTLERRYATAAVTPVDIVRDVHARIAARGGDGVWISLLPPEALVAAARDVEARRSAGEVLPLYGVPFGVKDNIDVAGLPTTAACPAFAYTPARSAACVARLVAAGAIVIGKTNMDQFATGLVGVRSPYGIPRNPFDADFVAGGSSSGSAVAVAVGEVSFALGTDTAGSGRVPAGFNNIVGLKPSRGVISTVGVVPACRSLDCVSVFAATCEDAARVAELMRGFDPDDPYARRDADSVRFAPEPPASSRGPRFRFGVPTANQREFGGDAQAAAFQAAIAQCIALGGAPVDVDLGPFLEVGALLYEGPFVAERLEAAGRLLAERPEALLAPIRSILVEALDRRAGAVFAAQARLQLLRRQVGSLWREMDFLSVPSAPTLPRIDAVEKDPLGLNAALGRYSTFVNLLDLAALSVPAGFRADGLPAGVTLIGPWGGDARLAGFGTRIHRATSSRVGATTRPLPPPAAALGSPDLATAAGGIPIAVVGAHLAGEPLNHQLTSAGARLARACRTAARYRLYALPKTAPPKPGLVRSDDGGGVAVEVEVWELPAEAFANFVARIPAPLCIGKLELEDGSEVSGFLCEPHATVGATDISAFGGWRAYLRAKFE